MSTVVMSEDVGSARRVRTRHGNGFGPAAQRFTPGSVSVGARLTFAELQNSPALQAAPEAYLPVIRHAAAVGPSDVDLLSPNGVPVSLLDGYPPISILNHSGTAGYAFVRSMCVLKHAKGWGEVLKAVRYVRAEQANAYKAPSPGKFVVVKKLRKRVVDTYLKGPNRATPVDALRHIDEEYLARVLPISGRENPYREISRMQQFGDNVHMLRPIECLQDDDFIYIFMPHACERGSLDQVIFHPTETLSVSEAQCIFVQICNILAYLCHHNIHHRDLSPDNFIFLSHNHLVVMDLAMSVRMPVDPKTRQRAPICGMGVFGTRAFMSPEIYQNFRVFDGVAADLWSAMLILYAMLTRRPLYRQPDAAIDISFRYYVLSRAITQDATNELIAEILADVFDGEHGNPAHQHILVDQAYANLALTPDARTLFHNVFNINIGERWTLAQVMESDFCCSPQEG